MHQHFLVDDVIQKIINNYSFNNTIKFVKRVPEALTLESDSQLIEQVLNNLVTNTIKFVDKNSGIIEIRVEEKEYLYSSLYVIMVMASHKTNKKNCLRNSIK